MNITRRNIARTITIACFPAYMIQSKFIIRCYSAAIIKLIITRSATNNTSMSNFRLKIQT